MVKKFRLKTKLFEGMPTFFFIVIIVLSIAYTVRFRSVDDFLQYPIYFSGILYIILESWLLARWFYGGFIKVTTKILVILLLAPLLISLITCITYYSIGAGIKDLYLWLQLHTDIKQTVDGVTALLTFILGFTLFLIRLKFRCIYGLSETIVGVAVAVQRVSGESTSTSLWDSGVYLVVLTAGVYLVVRGLDNMHLGITKEPIDPIAKKIGEFIFEISWSQKIVDPKNGPKIIRRSTVLRKLRRVR